MQVKLITRGDESFLECLPHGGRIQSEADALDLVAACGEHGVNRLLFYEENLTDDFFDLRTGLAGAVLLKFSNYTLRAAAVISSVRASTGRFGEMVLEANRRNHDFRVFAERESAEAWLLWD